MQNASHFPTSHIIGDTLIVERTYADVAVGDGWTVAVTFVAMTGDQLAVTATESGNVFLFTLTAALSAQLRAGSVSWAVTAKKDGARYTLERGSFVASGDPTAGATGKASLLAHVERVIAACEARIEGKITDDVQMYQLPDGVTVSKLTLREVRETLSQYRAKRRRMINGGSLKVLQFGYGTR